MPCCVFAAEGLVRIPFERDMEPIGHYRADLPLCCTRLFCFSSVFNQSFQCVSLLFLLTGWFPALVNYYLVLYDLEMSLTDNYSFILMLAMEEQSLLLTACTDMYVHEGLPFLMAARYLQELNTSYSKPLNIKSSSIYETKNLSEFIAMLFTTDSDRDAPGRAI